MFSLCYFDIVRLRWSEQDTTDTRYTSASILFSNLSKFCELFHEHIKLYQHLASSIEEKGWNSNSTTDFASWPYTVCPHTLIVAQLLVWILVLCRTIFRPPNLFINQYCLPMAPVYLISFSLRPWQLFVICLKLYAFIICLFAISDNMLADMQLHALLLHRLR